MSGKIQTPIDGEQYVRHDDYDAAAIGEQFAIHMDAMTAEGLHSKAHIAFELARRDAALATEREKVRELEEALRSTKSRLEEDRFQFGGVCTYPVLLPSEREAILVELDAALAKGGEHANQ